jgi:spore coat polysaccharide biosynthesis protein SpsF
MPDLDITYRLAREEDCFLFFEWANDEQVRKNSFSPAEIAWEDHVNWYMSKLNSGNSFLFVFFNAAKAIGQLRLDKFGDELLQIDYSVDKDWRGKKLGQQILFEAKVIADKFFPLFVLKGVVQNENAASMKAFENAGFIKKEIVVTNNIPCTIYNSH